MGSMIEFARPDCGRGLLIGPPAQGIRPPGELTTPFQGHFANQDDWCTPAAVKTPEAAMKGAGQSPEIFRYGAAHAVDERRAVYGVACANQAWERMVGFLEKRL